MKDSSMAQENLQVRGPLAVGMEKGRKGRWRLSRLKVSGLNFHDKTRQNASDHVLPKFTHFKSSLSSGRGSQCACINASVCSQVPETIEAIEDVL